MRNNHSVSGPCHQTFTDASSLMPQKPGVRRSEIDIVYCRTGIRRRGDNRNFRCFDQGFKRYILKDFQQEMRPHSRTQNTRRPDRRCPDTAINLSDSGSRGTAQYRTDIARILNSVKQHRILDQFRQCVINRFQHEKNNIYAIVDLTQRTEKAVWQKQALYIALFAFGNDFRSLRHDVAMSGSPHTRRDGPHVRDRTGINERHPVWHTVLCELQQNWTQTVSACDIAGYLSK